MSEIGNFLLIATMGFSSLSIMVSYVASYVIPAKAGIQKKILDFCSRRNNITSLPFYLSSLCGTFAFLILIYAFITSDFSLQNVFLNSSTLKPLIYKIVGSWSSHEGSMLLWFTLLQIISCSYILLLKNKRDKSLSIFILSIIQLLFSSFIYFTSNPFSIFSFIPKEGLGLNPMLQDIALSIHPPLLYLGYVSYVVPFTIVSAGLLSILLCTPLSMSFLRNQESSIDPRFREDDIKNCEDDLRLLKAFSNIGILFTTIGIALGSWWAYRELGWGGFWFFDPVENISLFPWLSGIMLHHSIMVTMKKGRMQNWTITLSIVTFLLVIFSTFLVRSGFITSIHSFAFSSERGVYLLTIFLILGFGSLGLYTIMSFPRASILSSRWMTGSIYSNDLENWTVKQGASKRSLYKISEHASSPKFCRNNSSKQMSILLGNIFFLLSLIILISATLYPLVYSLFDDKPIIIGEAFFINNFIIFVIPILSIMGLFTTNSSFKKHIIFLILSLTVTYFISLKIKFGTISILTVIASIFLMLHNIYYIFIKTDFFKQSLKAATASMILGHFGFALISFSIAMNALLQKELDFTGSVGITKTFDEFKVTLQNIKFAQGKNYYRQIAEFWLEDNNQNITILKPENRLYIVEKSLSQESDIYSYLFYDLYAVLSNIDDDVIHAKIYYKPMMSFIWLGIFITASGFLIGLLSNKQIALERKI